MKENMILEEAVQEIREILSEELNNIYIERVVFGLFFSGVKLSNGDGGACFTLIDELPDAVCCPTSAQVMPNSGRLTRKPVTDYLGKIPQNSIFKKTLAICILNALSKTCWDRGYKNYEIIEGANAFDYIKKIEGKTVVIGALVPAMKKLIKDGANFVVLEKNIKVFKENELKYYRSDEEAQLHIPNADQLIITGTTLINDTLPKILKMAKPEASIILAGPTASMLPNAFLKRGVNILGGIIVKDADNFLDTIGEAGSGYHFFGKSAQKLVIKNVEN